MVQEIEIKDCSHDFGKIQSQVGTYICLIVNNYILTLLCCLFTMLNEKILNKHHICLNLIKILESLSGSRHWEYFLL